MSHNLSEQSEFFIEYSIAPKHKRQYSFGDHRINVDDIDTNYTQIDSIHHYKGSQSYEGTNPSRDKLHRVYRNSIIWDILQFASDLKLHEIAVKFKRRQNQILKQSNKDDMQKQDYLIKPLKKSKARTLDLILIIEQLHFLMLANKIFTIPTPSHPVLLFRLLMAFEYIIDDEIIDAQSKLQQLNRNFFKYQSRTLKAFTQEDYFTQFISQQCHSIENVMNLPESTEYNLKHYLFLIIEQIQINNIELDKQLVKEDYRYIDTIISDMGAQMNQHIQQWLPDKKPNQPKIKATIGYNIAVAQLRLGIINSQGDKHKFTVPFKINQLTHIKVDSLYQDIAKIKASFPKYNGLSDKLFQTITNRHSEQNLIVALCLECEKATLEPNSLFDEIYKQFSDQQYGNIESVYKIVLEIASVKQICPTCQLFLDSDHQEITSMIQNNLKDKQLIKNINNDLILRKRTVFIYDQIRTIETNNAVQLKNARISEQSSGIFSIEMILNRYSTGQKQANYFLGKPLKDIQYNNTMIFSGRNDNQCIIQQVDNKLLQTVDSQSSESSFDEELIERIIEVLQQRNKIEQPQLIQLNTLG